MKEFVNNVSGYIKRIDTFFSGSDAASYPVAIYLIRNNLAEEIWSEINYAARGAFWEGTSFDPSHNSPRASIYSRIQSSLIFKTHK